VELEENSITARSSSSREKAHQMLTEGWRARVLKVQMLVEEVLMRSNVFFLVFLSAILILPACARDEAESDERVVETTTITETVLPTEDPMVTATLTETVTETTTEPTTLADPPAATATRAPAQPAPAAAAPPATRTVPSTQPTPQPTPTAVQPAPAQPTPTPTPAPTPAAKEPAPAAPAPAPAEASPAAKTPPRTHTVDYGGVKHAPGADNPVARCGACHGKDLRGGKAAPSSCYSCHDQTW
jgi:hypothetical protein